MSSPNKSQYFRFRINRVIRVSPRVCARVHRSNCYTEAMSKRTKNISSKVSEGHLSEAFHNLITREETQDLVRASVSANAELLYYQLHPYSDEKIGFLGSHLRLTVDFQRNENNETQKRSFFVKTLPFDVPSQAAYIQEKGCIQKETKFFEVLAPLLANNFKGEDWVPKCYLAKHDVMVFEDLKPEGFTNRSRLLDEKSVKVALGCIARMHASSMVAEDRIQGKSLKDLFPDIFTESEFKREGRTYNTYRVGVNLAVDLANDLGLDSSNIRLTSERVFDVGRSSKTKRNVVCHGDLWSSNLIFDQSDHCRLVDFQMVRYLPPAHDLMMLLYWGTSKNVRQKHEKEFISHYYQELEATLKLNDFKGIVPSYGELLQGIEELRPAALLTSVLFSPMTMMDGQEVARIMNDPHSYESFYFGDRKYFVYEYMAKNPDYEKRIKDLVGELVEMSKDINNIPKYT